ncbi:MAG TPA: SDR family NAD(P)-dependent oxidoreductase [Candidatus Binataceae bacterium]|nr:SDR family NAD(P)-dependent oxidoreductase [Candidatus Binataceae bacterium]
MGLRLEGKNALITGGASGIGRATAIRFAEEGANVLVADRHLAAAEETAVKVRALGRKAIAFQVDTSAEAEVAAMVDRCVKELGSVDILVAAAGISHARYGEEGTPAMGPLAEKPLADWKKVLSVNLDGVFITDREVARAMIKAGKGGRIINISSGAAKLPTPGVGEYSVSKAGVWMLTKVLAVELAPHGITANAIGPGFINTPMTADIQQAEGFMKVLLERVPMKKMGDPVDVANTALFLASEEGRYYTGSILHPDGGVVMQ